LHRRDFKARLHNFSLLISVLFSISFFQFSSHSIITFLFRFSPSLPIIHKIFAQSVKHILLFLIWNILYNFSDPFLYHELLCCHLLTRRSWQWERIEFSFSFQTFKQDLEEEINCVRCSRSQIAQLIKFTVKSEICSKIIKIQFLNKNNHLFEVRQFSVWKSIYLR